MICLETVKKYCKEYYLIENYQEAMADESQTWYCHHRHEIDWVLPREELIAIGRYYDVHYSELIFLTPAEHNRLHHVGKVGPWRGKVGPSKGKRHTEESKQKMSNAQKGKPKSEEWKQNISDSLTKYQITKEELYNLYVVQGFTQKHITKLLGCSKSCLQRKLKKYNITKNG